MVLSKDDEFPDFSSLLRGFDSLFNHCEDILFFYKAQKGIFLRLFIVQKGVFHPTEKVFSLWNDRKLRKMLFLTIVCMRNFQVKQNYEFTALEK